GTRHRRARSRVSGHRRDPQSEAADPPAGRGRVLDRSLPRLLRARRHRPHLVRNPVSLDAGCDSPGVRRSCPTRPGDDRGSSKRDPLRTDQELDDVLVIRRTRRASGRGWQVALTSLDGPCSISEHMAIMTTVDRRWTRLPTAVRAILTGVIVATAGTLPWAALVSTNIRHQSRVA